MYLMNASGKQEEQLAVLVRYASLEKYHPWKEGSAVYPLLTNSDMMAYLPAISPGSVTLSASVWVYSHESHTLIPSDAAACMIAPTTSWQAPCHEGCNVES